MKSLMRVYDYCKLPIRITFFAFCLIAFGQIVQSESFNIFYTIKNSLILTSADICLKIGQAIIINLPLIFMTNVVCKKANSGLPIVLSIVGFLVFNVTTMMFGNQNLGNSAYLNYSLVAALGTGRLPLQTGIIGPFLIGYITRLSYIRSRNRSSRSLLIFTHKDTDAIIVNTILSFFLGLIVAYGYPYAFNALQFALNYISKDLMDPYRIALYGFLDRLLSIFGLGNLIRNPFWYSALGGSYSNQISGQAVLGDVNIWSFIRETNTSYLGAGRFITPYYVINIFIMPAFYIGTLLCISDKSERRRYIIPVIFAVLISIIFGNPLPAELTMLFTAPLLLLLYLILVALVFAILVYQNIFLGFINPTNSTVTAMPGNFPDYIINLRNVIYRDAVGNIAIIGLIAFAIMLVIMFIYYHFLSYDVLSTGKIEDLCDKIGDALGGYDNILDCGSGLFKAHFILDDLEKVSFEKLSDLGAKRVSETRNGISIELGVSSLKITKKIKKIKKKDKRN